MNEKPNARELLKECRGALLRGQADEQMAMVAGIDAYLAAPSESAMEMAMRIYYDCFLMGNGKFEAEKAAALIEDFGRRVPMAMLDEVRQRMGI